MNHLNQLSRAWALGLTLCLAGTSMAQTSTFPSKALKIVVPNAAGGAADITARTVAQKLSESLGQPVVTENKPSAGGIVAGEQVARSDPDGHTLLLISSGTAVSASLFKTLPFDTVKDFIPVSKLATFDLVIAEYFLSASGLQAQIVPFNGTPPVINALRGGSLDAMVEILGPLMPQIKSNAVRPLALLGDKRTDSLPGVPTVQESGGSLAKFQASSWNGLAVPARTPRDVVMRLNREIQTIMEMPDVKKRLSDLNLNAQSSSPEQAAEALASDIKRWQEVIAKAKIEKQ